MYMYMFARKAPKVYDGLGRLGFIGFRLYGVVEGLGFIGLREAVLGVSA